MRRAHEALLSSLAHRECGPRSHAVAVFDELFHRSAQFRARTLDRLDLFLKRAVGTDPDQHPMPGPAAETDALVARAVRALDGWNAKFGPHLPRLAVASRFVADVLGPNAPAAREAAARRDRGWKPPGEKTPGRSNDGDASRRTRYRLCVATRARPRSPWKSAYARCWEGTATTPSPTRLTTTNGRMSRSSPTAASSTARRHRSARMATFRTRASIRVRSGSTIGVSRHRPPSPWRRRRRTRRRWTTRGTLPRRRSTVGTTLVAALALLARVAAEEGGITPEERANAVNVLAGAKRRLVDALDRCRAVGVDAPETRRDEEEKSTEENARVRSAEEQEAAATGAAARGPNDETSDGGMRITVAGVASPRDEEDAALVAAAAAREDAALDALLDRARRRREWTRRAAGRGGGGGGRGNVPGAPFWMGRSANVRTRGGGGVGDAETGSTPSVRASREEDFRVAGVRA